jgi:hypothetical protein
MKRILIVATIVGFCALVTSLSLAQTDPLVGTWKLNLDQSKYTSPAPRSEIVTYDADRDGLTYTVKRVDAAGANATLLGRLATDGKDHPATGTADWDSAMTHRVNRLTTETIRKRSGTQVQSVTRAVSADGKRLTLTTKGIDAAGHMVNDVQVYDRQ